MNMHERHERLATFIGDASIHVISIHFKEEARHSVERRGTPRVDARPEASGPRE
jgi:hypothetical protein